MLEFEFYVIYMGCGIPSFFKKNTYFWPCWLFVASCMLFSSWGLLFVVVWELLTAVISLVELGSRAFGLQQLQPTGSIVVVLDS